MKQFFESLSAKLKATYLDLPIKAILDIDNALTHPDELKCDEDSNIFFLPTNLTSFIQPMVQGGHLCLKRCYRGTI